MRARVRFPAAVPLICFSSFAVCFRGWERRRSSSYLDGNLTAYRWSLSSGAQMIGPFVPYGVSYDGSAIVGRITQPNIQIEGFIEPTRLISLKEIKMNPELRLIKSRTRQVLAIGIVFLASTESARSQSCMNWVDRSLPAGVSFLAMTFDTTRAVSVVFGGVDGFGGTTDQMAEWNGIGWTQPSPLTLPESRGAHAMAFDSSRGVTILFGGGLDNDSNGYPDSHFQDTWEWDGVSWAQRFPSTSPAPRGYHAMTYDSTRHVCVLFGGDNGDFSSNETWEWNGIDWVQHFPATSPAPSAGPALVYDTAREVSVLFAGGETWEWDGTN
ncbi:MAG TPA: hypothetical protein VNT79_15760 [Phycisphaerae bacterium]|nr:hypothetical protein [Phycisphaerae bacterium]